MIQHPDSCLISIVTVVYNGVSALEKTIQSVATQSFSSIEHIIVDGGSTDGTIDIIKKHEPSISTWISEKDSGIYNAMNKGVSLSKGKWVCFLNCGDVFVDDQTVQKVAEAIQVSENIDIFYGNILVNTYNGDMKERIAVAPCNKHRMFFCHQSAFVKKELLRKYPFDEKYKMSADFKFFKLCYHHHHKFVHLNFPIVIYDTSGISNTNREAGLIENTAVIKEMDKGRQKCLFLLHLYFVIYWIRLTRKK